MRQIIEFGKVCEHRPPRGNDRTTKTTAASTTTATTGAADQQPMPLRIFFIDTRGEPWEMEWWSGQVLQNPEFLGKDGAGRQLELIRFAGDGYVVGTGTTEAKMLRRYAELEATER